VRLAWTPSTSSNEVGYRVTLNVPHQAADTGNRPNRLFFDLRPGTTFTASLATFDGRGNRAPAVTLTFTTLAREGAPPTAPTNLRGVYVGGVLHSIAWDASRHSLPVSSALYSEISVSEPLSVTIPTNPPR